MLKRNYKELTETARRMKSEGKRLFEIVRTLKVRRATVSRWLDDDLRKKDRAAVKAARKAWVVPGRKDHAAIKADFASGMSLAQVAKKHGMLPGHVNRVVKADRARKVMRRYAMKKDGLPVEWLTFLIRLGLEGYADDWMKGKE